MIALLKKEGESGKVRDNWSCFMEAADFAGVRVSLEGELPRDEKNLRLFVTAAAEALTNAVRHGNADALFIRILHTGGELYCRFTNNGKKPEHSVTEGGGLGALRMRIENCGGCMKTEWKPCFLLEICLPEGEKEC